MTTGPLDVANLAAAARAETWDGAPPGTRIAHVHLSVGSLDEAEASITARSASTRPRGATRARRG
jgi:catechol-2,3-dioxygenase